MTKKLAHEHYVTIEIRKHPKRAEAEHDERHDKFNLPFFHLNNSVLALNS